MNLYNIKNIGKSKTNTAILAVFVFLILCYFLTKSFEKDITNLSLIYEYKVDFDDSMQTQQFKETADKYWGPDLLKFFRELYQKTNFVNIKPSREIKIEKIIHQIWLGSPFPDKYKKFQESWITNHPDWQYKLWTDKEVKDIVLENRELYNKARNYGEKSDILRYEILYKFGGLYIDTDFECLKPLDILHYYYDFYIGIQPLDTSIVQLGIGLIGAKAGHPILKEAINALKTSTSVQIVSKTGPIFFTKLFWHNILKFPGINTALPASYFYPCGYNQKASDRVVWIKPESFAVHHWEGSWLSPDAFEKSKV